jgi:hypothetical protein
MACLPSCFGSKSCMSMRHCPKGYRPQHSTYLVGEFLTVRRRPSELSRRDNESLVGPKPEIPPNGPVVSLSGLWAAMDDKSQRVCLVGIEACRVKDKCLDLYSKISDSFDDRVGKHTIAVLVQYPKARNVVWSQALQLGVNLVSSKQNLLVLTGVLLVENTT